MYYFLKLTLRTCDIFCKYNKINVTNEDSFLHMQLGINVAILSFRTPRIFYDVARTVIVGAPEKKISMTKFGTQSIRQNNNTQFSLIFLHLSVRKVLNAPHRARLPRKQEKVKKKRQCTNRYIYN
jgi:hypothetical protein